MDKNHLRYLGIAALVVLGLWIATPTILFQVFCNATSPQEVEAIRKQWEIDPYNRNYFGFGTREQALDSALQSHKTSVELNGRLLQQFELLADYIKDLETLYQTIRQSSAQIE